MILIVVKEAVLLLDQIVWHVNMKTGFCINKENVCDGHPQPSCGGDDEGVDHCLNVYFKQGEKS